MLVEASFFLLPLWEKVARTKSAPDEGFFAAETTPHPSSLREATLSHKGRGEGVAAYPALAAFFLYARCTAQLQPGGCVANSVEATSLAGAAVVGDCVGITSFTRRSCAD